MTAIAVATSIVLPGVVNASLGNWSEGLNHNITFGGELVQNDTGINWLWSVGGGFDAFTAPLSDLTADGKVLDIKIQQNMPLIASKMKEGSWHALTGFIPTVTLASFDDTPIVVDFTDKTHAQMSVKVKDENASYIGNITIPFEYGASGTMQDRDGGVAYIASVENGGAGTIFDGLVKPSDVASSAIALKWNGLTEQDVYNSMKIVGGNSITGPGKVTAATVNMRDLSHNHYTSNDIIRYFTYGSGITAGTTLHVTYNNPVTSYTKWSAPIKLTVTYR
ncbi:TPA: hypothetical protein ACSG4Z_004186 [Escherichia coli]|uniref:F4 family fimbrial subunit n=1 Tax=Escherichia coli TaxID=562 RepID=UPI0012FFF68D|nr:hypothetical protein [Escherichia coli]